MLAAVPIEQSGSLLRRRGSRKAGAAEDRLSSASMPRPTALVRIAPLARLRARLLMGSLLPALLLMGSLASAPAQAADSPASTDPPAAADDGSTNWGPIIGACFGVLFGGALALWQIRSMKNRR
jgi:hypothetical protein